MFASSGEATAPCGVPTSVFDHFPSSDTPAHSHFWIRRSILRSANAVLDELDQPFVRQIIVKAPNVCIENPVHLLPHDSYPERIQSIVLAAPRPESIGEPQEILFVNLVEDSHHGLLNDLILQDCDAQGALPSIGFRDVGSLRRLRSIRPPMDLAMKVHQLLIQVCLVLFPRHAIDSGRGLSLQGVVAVPQQSDGNVVEQRGKPRPLVFTCCLTHTGQVAHLADPALSPGRDRLPDVLLGRLPSLRALRRRLPTVVRTLRQYYATVRLPIGVHVGLPAHSLLQPARRLIRGGRQRGLPGSRAWSFHACLGSQTAQSPPDACDSARVGIAFRHAERRRHSGRDYFAAQYPACMCPCQPFDRSL